MVIKILFPFQRSRLHLNIHDHIYFKDKVNSSNTTPLTNLETLLVNERGFSFHLRTRIANCVAIYKFLAQPVSIVRFITAQVNVFISPWNHLRINTWVAPVFMVALALTDWWHGELIVAPILLYTHPPALTTDWLTGWLSDCGDAWDWAG